MSNPLYIAARAVLLDALDGLGPQRDAVILAGAQAIYIHTGAADLAVAEYTTDSDIVIDPTLLRGDPRLAEAMERAKFRLGPQPGIWLQDRIVDDIPASVSVDLLVPAAVAGGGNRAARLGAHGDRTGRIVRGLEGALVDHDSRKVGALDDGDGRSFEIRVAGPAALLIAKLHKISDRQTKPSGHRLKDKDALDVLRLLRAFETEVLAGGLQRLQEASVAGDVTREAVDMLPTLFGTARAVGTLMAVRATERLEPADAIAASCVALTNDLLEAMS